jgi:hypothetical protein
MHMNAPFLLTFYPIFACESHERTGHCGLRLHMRLVWILRQAIDCEILGHFRRTSSNQRLSAVVLKTAFEGRRLRCRLPGQEAAGTGAILRPVRQAGFGW